MPTVSRVLTKSKFVAPELAERVNRAVEELGYRPNSAARATRSGVRTLVTVLSGATGNYGYARTIEGVEAAGRRAGLSVMVSVVESESDADVRRAVDLVLSQPVAGVIVLEFDKPGRATLRHLPPTLPFVVAGGGSRRSGNPPYALLDERAAGREATRYLLDLGHTTVHHIAGPTMGKHSGRTAGWRSELVDAGIEPPPIMHSGWDPRSGYAWGKKIAGRDDVTAVFCGSDDIALGVMRALVEEGVRIPEDVSVVGFDDQPHVAMWVPALTTVRQDFDDLGGRALGLLTQLIGGEADVASSIVTPGLVVRESSGPPPRR